MNRELSDMIKNMDKNKLQSSIAEAKRFLATPEGKSAMDKLSHGEMPNGGAIPDDLKKAAEALSRDPESAKKLAALFNR